MTDQTTYITDPDDFCRICKGKGYQTYEEYVGHSYQRQTISETCWACGGRGCKSILRLGSRSKLDAEFPILEQPDPVIEREEINAVINAETAFLTTFKWEA